MISHISIQNYALIESLEIDFGKGLSIITGETGAGKSVLLGALGLILGKRADTKVLFDTSKKCIVEGVFDISGYGFEGFFEQYDLDYDDKTLLRREITPYGKSRAFINDTPVGLPVLKELGDKLIDIHSQHQTLTLNDSGFRLAVIDGFAGITEQVAQYGKMFGEYKRLQAGYDELTAKEKQSKAEQDYFQFLFDELEKANLNEGEQQVLERELKVLEHAEEIKTNLNNVITLLDNEESGVLPGLSSVISLLSKIEGFSEKLNELNKRTESVFIELKDILNELETFDEEIVFDPEKANEISGRLDLIYSLEQKHRVQTVEELIEKREELSFKLKNITSLSEQLDRLKLQLDKAKEKVLKEAELISAKRNKITGDFDKEVTQTLKFLGMTDAVFRTEIEKMNIPGVNGVDRVKFLFSANKGAAMQELSKVASGGELSRLMLAIKSLISQRNLLPTVIFDEIDMGVSGNIADKMGEVLRKLSDALQVIAITHLPQIAGKGNTHYVVTKRNIDGKTRTFIKRLNKEERIIEIAKMLSGSDISSASVETAKQLLKN